MAPRQATKSKAATKPKRADSTSQSAADRLRATRAGKENIATDTDQVSSADKISSSVSPSKLNGDNKPRTKGSIQSFFNNATQRLQASQEFPRRLSRASTPLESEIIDSDEDGSVFSFSKGSSTALALRKRKAQNNATHDDASTASQKFRRTEAGRAHMALVNDDKRPWTVQFAPSTLSELAVHKRKVADVRGWLENALAGRRNRALIIKGPAGAGKTTTLRLLAQDMGIEVLEWSNPAGKDYADPAQATQFEEFVARSGASTGLFFAIGDEQDNATAVLQQPLPELDRSRLLLVEEFPSTFSKSSPALQSFRSAIAQHLVHRGNRQPVPLIMIISETLSSTNTAAVDSFTTHRLLGPELSVHPQIDTVEFNAVAPTIILKALNDIVIKEARRSGRRTTPALVVLKRLSDFGDLRSAVSTLEFLCLRGDDEGNWSTKVAFGKTKKKAADAPLTKVEQEALTWISSRENTLGIFHAVGKIIYNKRVEPQGTSIARPPSWYPQHHRATVPENDVNSLINDIGTDALTFIAALHENYPLSCNGLATEQALDAAFGCIESLSDADLLSVDRFSMSNRAAASATETLRQDEMSFQLGVRGLLFGLPPNAKRIAPAGGVRSDAHRMYYPASLKLWRQREEIEAAIDSIRLQLRSQLRASPGEKTDTAYSLANTTATPWSRDEEDEDSVHANTSGSLSSMTLASKEVLLASLPYLISPLEHMTANITLLELLRLVTRITRGGIDDPGDNDVDATENDAGAAEQWHSDHTEGPKRLKQPILSKKTDPLTAGETSLASLVLKDDDIVDD